MDFFFALEGRVQRWRKLSTHVALESSFCLGLSSDVLLGGVGTGSWVETMRTLGAIPHLNPWTFCYSEPKMKRLWKSLRTAFGVGVVHLICIPPPPPLGFERTPAVTQATVKMADQEVKLLLSPKKIPPAGFNYRRGDFRSWEAKGEGEEILVVQFCVWRGQFCRQWTEFMS